MENTNLLIFLMLVCLVTFVCSHFLSLLDLLYYDKINDTEASFKLPVFEKVL